MNETEKTGKPEPALKRQLSVEESRKLAFAIEQVKVFLPMIDVEYAKLAVKSMYEQASRQYTLAVLNPRYDPARSTLIGMQARGLDFLIKFIESMTECAKMKDSIKAKEVHYEDIEKMFL